MLSMKKENANQSHKVNGPKTKTLKVKIESWSCLVAKIQREKEESKFQPLVEVEVGVMCVLFVRLQRGKEERSYESGTH